MIWFGFDHDQDDMHDIQGSIYDDMKNCEFAPRKSCTKIEMLENSFDDFHRKIKRESCENSQYRAADLAARPDNNCDDCLKLRVD